MIKTYEEAVDVICVNNFIDNWDHTKPMETLGRIINNEVNQALDPKISLKAVALIKKHGGVI